MVGTRHEHRALGNAGGTVRGFSWRLPGTVLKADNLRWKFRQGEVVRYTIVQETALEERLEGQEGKTSLSQTVDLHWTVKSLLPDGVAEMTQIDRPGSHQDSRTGTNVRV